MQKENITTKPDLMKYIDSQVTPEEREELLKVKNPIELHFGFGTWIRNQFIYDDPDIDVAAIYNPQEQFVIYHADELSGLVIADYLKYLHGEPIDSQASNDTFAIRIVV